MSYDIIERSAYKAQPIELYVFTRDSEIYRYTSGQGEVIISGQLYENFNIKRAKIEQNQDIGRNPVSFDADHSLPFVQQYLGSPPTDIINVKILRYHASDNTKETIIFWLGRVVNVKFNGDKVSLRCEPIFTSLKRPTLRRLYQRTCPHLLYGPICTINKDSFKTVSIVSAVSGTTIKSNSFTAKPNGYFSGGLLLWKVNNVTNKRFILTHNGDTLVINLPFPGITPSNSVDAFPGCDHTLNTCSSKFFNHLNYGGFPYIPQKNPFSGSPIF
jgi:uncharacterized phage protein (TIGR02218 family)